MFLSKLGRLNEKNVSKMAIANFESIKTQLNRYSDLHLETVSLYKRINDMSYTILTAVFFRKRSYACEHSKN